MEPLLIASVTLTALLSGVFGMAGGVLLLLILSLRMGLAQAMVLHGAAQLTANGLRAAISYRDIRTGVLLPFAAGAALSVGVSTLFALNVDTGTALIVTGLVPFLTPFLARAPEGALRLLTRRSDKDVRLPPRFTVPQADTRLGALACGVSVTTLHLSAGATGPLLDLFFMETRYSRHEVVATKAVAQCLGHALKVLYFGALIGSGGEALALPWLTLLVASAVGTFAGRALLARIDETFFRKGTRGLVRGLGALSILRGLAAL